MIYCTLLDTENYVTIISYTRTAVSLVSSWTKGHTYRNYQITTLVLRKQTRGLDNHNKLPEPLDLQNWSSVSLIFFKYEITAR